MLKFKLKRRPSREQAIGWLLANNIKYPKTIENDIEPVLFYGWRFVRGLDGVVYFANCISPGITEHELNKEEG